MRGALRLVYAEDTDDMRDYLINNLANFKRITKPPRGEFSEPRIFYTGKDSGEDDVTMCAIIGNSKPKSFLTNDRYRQFWRHVPLVPHS